MPSPSDPNPYLRAAADNVTDSLGFMLAKIIKGNDPHQCYGAEFIRALAAAEGTKVRQAESDLKEHFKKDFKIPRWRADIRDFRNNQHVDRPTGRAIDITGTPLHQMSVQACEALVQRNAIEATMFDMPDGPALVTRNGGAARLTCISADRMRGEIDRVVGWVRFTQSGPKPASAPLDVARDILSRPEDLHLPRLAAIVRRPYLAENGKLIESTGYNPATQIYYDRPAGFPAIGELRDDEISASRSAEWLLDEVFGDFPFDGPTSRINTLALLLTACLRNLIPGSVPAAAVSATSHGSGKSLVADIVSLIDNGTRAAMTGLGKTEEEIEKQLTSLFLRDAGGLVVFDNIQGYLDSANLARAMTGVWDGRKLGSNNHVTVNQRCTHIWNGNNLSISNELSRRCYLIRLVSETSQPNKRSGFKHDPIREWCLENRALILNHVFTIAKSWMSAGRPMMTSVRLGSFESFAQIIGGILNYAGVGDFLSNQSEQMEGTDSETSEWEAFIEAIEEWRGTGYWTVSELVKEMNSNTTSGIAMLNSVPSIIATYLQKRVPEISIGRVLKNRRERRFGARNTYFTTTGTTHSPVRWILSRDAGA